MIDYLSLPWPQHQKHHTFLDTVLWSAVGGRDKRLIGHLLLEMIWLLGRFFRAVDLGGSVETNQEDSESDFVRTILSVQIVIFSRSCFIRKFFYTIFS